MTEHVVSAESLTSFVSSLVGKLGAPSDIAAEVAGHLVTANLSGHDSHGVARLKQYAAQISDGALLPDARPAVLSEQGAVALFDARRGFGQYSTASALAWASDRARQLGVGVAVIRHSMHIGRLGEYTERAAAQGLVAIVTAGAAGEEVGAVGMPGASGRYLGTNPWSFGFPTGGDPIMFDGSMSTVAEGKVRLAQAAGQQLPPGCIVDRDGHPSTEPADFYNGGSIVPLGGAGAGHKGFGLGLAAALLGGLSAVGDDNPTLLGAAITGKGNPDTRVSGVFVLVIDPSFVAGADYPAVVARVASGLKQAPPRSADSGPILPGEPEMATRARRAATGIVINAPTWADLETLAATHGVPLP